MSPLNCDDTAAKAASDLPVSQHPTLCQNRDGDGAPCIRGCLSQQAVHHNNTAAATDVNDKRQYRTTTRDARHMIHMTRGKTITPTKHSSPQTPTQPNTSPNSPEPTPHHAHLPISCQDLNVAISHSAPSRLDLYPVLLESICLVVYPPAKQRNERSPHATEDGRQ